MNNVQSDARKRHYSTSLYLSQSYRDAWDDYQRSLKSHSFPVWDLVILTASNEHQARSFKAQLEARKDYLPTRTEFAVIPDEGGVRIGSGGATLAVLKYIKEQRQSFSGLRILVIHSGGDSKRVPQYSALGKLFSPVPHMLPDGRSSTLFDEFLISMATMPSRIREGMLLVSGDVLLLFNPLLIDYPGHGAAVISFKENVKTGKDHGVYLRGEDGNVKAFYHKQSAEKLRAVGATNDVDCVDIDTGAVIFGVDVLNSLWSLISVDDCFSQSKYKRLVNDTVRLSLYGDFQYAMATDSTLEQFYLEAPEGEFCPQLNEARKLVWEALRGYRLKLLRLAPAKFIHFGTTKEILQLMSEGVEQYSELGWSKRVNCSQNIASGYNSVISPAATVGKDVYAEVSYIHSGASVGEQCVLSYVDLCSGMVVPPHTVLHGLKQQNGKFVCRFFGTGDNPKENKLFGRNIEGNLWDENVPHTLWNANLYQECSTIKEAVEAALSLYSAVMNGRWKDVECLPDRKSLCSGFNDADSEAILAWNKRMIELVQMNDIAVLIDSKSPAKRVCLAVPLSRIQREWLETRIQESGYEERMRLYYYIGTALGGVEGEKMISEAFHTLSDTILNSAYAGLKENPTLRIAMEQHSVALPLRVNWGGGWSDTPPYCNECGGTVLNAAVLLNGTRPVSVNIKRLDEQKIVFESCDMDVYGEFEEIESLQWVGDPFDPFALQKAAILSCGVIPAKGGDLKEILERLGGGIKISTAVTGIPKGSGLGTSSILSAACVKALLEFFALQYKEEDIYAHVLCMEQIMSTGGGWQDQVGGLTDGIKYISSKPGLAQILTIHRLDLDSATMTELNERFALVYTGQRRLARNLLRDVIGRYISNEPDTIYALNEIQRLAALMRFELERGNVDAFAKLLSAHWELSKMIDTGSTNTLIDQIFDSIEDLVDGRMVCGAGGGGFLQVILKKGISSADLKIRLKETFSDTAISVWDCTLV